MTRILSAEPAPRGLRVNAIAASLVDAEGTRALGFIGPDAQTRPWPRSRSAASARRTTSAQ
jgi:NAD(P)-dependent dehydrogenase (short-subunit alcohol dehydrogenase family)